MTATDTLAPSTDALTILIVDDSAMMRALIRRAVAATGLPVGELLEAANGQQALDVLHERRVDALFTDITMPVMSGIELLRQINGDPRFEHLTRVIISTDGSETQRAEAGELAVRLYVTKPFPPEAMRAILTELVATR